jgi:hypothetical protein
MQLTELEYFSELKKEVAATFRQAFPSSPAEIEEWKGQDIVNFQEELIQKAKGRISEKWFYTHIKGTNEKLPRIDMLNLLSEYAGYQGWNDFVQKKKAVLQPGLKEQPVATVSATASAGSLKASRPGPGPLKKRNRSKLAVTAVVVLAGLLTISFLLYRPSVKKYSCCFVDMDGRTTVPNARIEVRILSLHESPVLKTVNDAGCFDYSTRENKIRFVVTSPYYLPDTVTRVLSSGLMEEKVKLRTNDYALMIHYFSTSRVQDWKKRRMQLDDMLADNAKIFHVYENHNTMELYNKEEFINRLTIPAKSLKNIEIIETEYNSSGRITRLRFRIKE